MPSIHTLIQDIHSLFSNPSPDLQYNGADVSFGEAVAAAARRALAPRGRARDVYMSSLGKCERHIWYDLKSDVEPEPLPPSAHIKFLFGSILEELLVLLAKLAGHSVEGQQDVVEVDGVRGRIDCKIDGHVMDIKSASTFSFRDIIGGGLEQSDPFGYLYQISGYREGTQTNNPVGFFIIEKEKGHLGIWFPDGSVLPDVHARISYIQETLSKDTPPDRPHPEQEFQKGGNRCLNTTCSYCKYKWACWSDANEGAGLRLFFYSNKPVFLTHVSKLPKVQEGTMEDYIKTLGD